MILDFIAFRIFKALDFHSRIFVVILYVVPKNISFI